MITFVQELEHLRDNGYQPGYNGRPSCPFCSNFVDDEETHAAGCPLVEHLAGRLNDADAGTLAYKIAVIAHANVDEPLGPKQRTSLGLTPRDIATAIIATRVGLPPTWCPIHIVYDHCEDATLAETAARDDRRGHFPYGGEHPGTHVHRPDLYSAIQIVRVYLGMITPDQAAAEEAARVEAPPTAAFRCQWCRGDGLGDHAPDCAKRERPRSLTERAVEEQKRREIVRLELWQLQVLDDAAEAGVVGARLWRSSLDTHPNTSALDRVDTCPCAPCRGARYVRSIG